MRLLTLALCFVPVAGFTAGGFDETPPEPSETTTTCEEGLVWDLATETCLPPEDSTNDDSARLNDVRELAYDGQYRAALRVLETLENGQSSLALTYYGFAHRKMGDAEDAMRYYQAALHKDPDNLLARSYMGQGHVASGDLYLAWVELGEIQARGGQGSWPEQALQQAILTGQGYSY